MSNKTQWDVETAALLATTVWVQEREIDRTPLRLQDLADHYARSKNVPQVMVRSCAREIIRQRLGITVDSIEARR